MSNSNKLSRNKRTEAQKAKISRQPQNTIRNKARKYAKHLKRHPKDLQSAEKRKAIFPVQHLSSSSWGKPGTSIQTPQETVSNQPRPPRYKQINEEHLGLVRISAKTLLKMHEYKNILLGERQSLIEANEKFSTDPLIFQ